MNPPTPTMKPVSLESQTTSISGVNQTAHWVNFNNTASESSLNFTKTIQVSLVSLTTSTSDQSRTTHWSNFNNIARKSNVMTPVLYFNKSNLTYTPEWLTTSISYLNQSNSTYRYTPESVSLPTTWLTYTLFCLSCLFAVLGLCGNCLLLVSLSKFRRRFNGHGVLIMSLAICDIFAVIAWATTQSSVQDLGLDIRAISGIACKASWAILYTAMYSSTAIVVLISIERFLAVWFPLRTRSLLSAKNMLRCVSICVTLIALTFVTMSVLYCEVRDGKCHPNFEGDAYSSVLNQMPDVSIYVASNGFIISTSMILLSIFTPLTIVKLYKQMRIRRQLTASELNAQHFATSVKLMSVVIAHITLLAFPIFVGIIFSVIGIIPAGNTLSALTIPLLLNHCINFVLYNIFDAEFRRNVLALLGFTKKDAKPELQLENVKNVPSGDMVKFK